MKQRRRGRHATADGDEPICTTGLEGGEKAKGGHGEEERKTDKEGATHCEDGTKNSMKIRRARRVRMETPGRRETSGGT